MQYFSIYNVIDSLSAAVQNIDKALKVGCLLVTSIEILVTSTKFSVVLVTSW